MAKETHVCAICGQGYTHCEYCSGVKSYSPWRNIVDTIDHYKIFIIVKDYNEKNIDKEQAKLQLESVDITGWKNFKPEVVKILSEILAEDEVIDETEIKFSNSKKK